jgi:hypothetical protein
MAKFAMAPERQSALGCSANRCPAEVGDHLQCLTKVDPMRSSVGGTMPSKGDPQDRLARFLREKTEPP